jgi:hypothetical protein
MYLHTQWNITQTKKEGNPAIFNNMDEPLNFLNFGFELSYINTMKGFHCDNFIYT